MNHAHSPRRFLSTTSWRDLVLPREHGSWSLALEPLALGLAVAPSPAGGWLAVAVIAAFFGRRPLRIACRDAQPERRRDARLALATCGLVATLALAAAISIAGGGWLLWLAPSTIAGALFLSFDLRNGGREELAEIAGSAAFALLPAAFAALAGATPAVAAVLALVMGGRAVPAVLTVRAVLRETKTGVRRPGPALVAAGAVLIAVGILAHQGLAPGIAVIALGVLALRTIGLLVFPRPALRARTLGMIEAVLGVAFVLVVAIGWRA